MRILFHLFRECLSTELCYARFYDDEKTLHVSDISAGHVTVDRKGKLIPQIPIIPIKQQLLSVWKESAKIKRWLVSSKCVIPSRAQ